AEFNTLFNGTTGSVKHYYLENSYNQFNLTVDVAGPYTASQNMAYYGANDASGNDVNPRALVSEAINLADPHVNFAEYDNDNDGWVDGVYIIYAGYGEEAGGGDNTIWAHAWSLYPPVIKDGVYIQKYSCSAELRGSSGTNITNIGVICHEFGHVLGAPDYYDTNYSTGGQYEGTGEWDMMAGGSWNNGGATPAHHNGYTKTKVYNWAQTNVLSQPTTVTLEQATFNSTSFYQINTTTANEYFLIENRQQQGFDAYIPGHGMIIYHVHSGVNQVGNEINATHPQRMYPVCASATVDPTSTPSSYGNINSLGCAWPYSAKTSFTDQTLPSSKSWAGNNTSKPITNIVRNTGNKTVSFDFMGGANTHTVTFTVVDAGNTPISGASIAINSQTLTTNTSGVATISLANGTYPYTISKVGFVNGTGNAVVSGANLSINKTLQDEIIAPYDVTATVINNNQAKVTWSPEPDFIDDIESYDDFIISNIGNYTLVDVDNSYTYGIQNYTFPNSGYTGSYIVFNPSATTPALTSANWAPHGGNKYLACFAAATSPNNDWLITHQVTVVPGMSFSFWARSYTIQYGADRFKVGVSTTGTAPTNFTIISAGEYIEAPAAWTQYTYNLDAYVGQQIYLAINCVSDDSFVLMIDDIFIGASKSDDSRAFLGYTVYLNDQVKASGLTTKEYTITNIPAGTHNVGVQSVYSSGASAIVYADPITVNPQYYTVTFTVVDAGNIPISGASIAINSQTLTTNASGVATISLENGTYAYIISKAGFVSANGDAVVNGANITINKTLAYQEYSLTLVANPAIGGAVNSVSGNYHMGDNITVIATPADGYNFINWTKDGVQVSTNSQFDYTMPSENVTLIANFVTISSHTVTFTVVDATNNPIEDATVAINSETLTTDASGIATIALENGTYPYTISKSGYVSVTGTAVVDGADVSINKTLIYQEYSLTLVANPTAGGTVNDVSGNYQPYSNITVIATPAEGYNFVNWTKDGVEVNTNAEFVYVMPSEDVTLTANFELIPTYTVTFTVIDNTNSPIESATIVINSETLATDASGVATIILENGTYPYTISKSGYVSVTGAAVVDGADVSINKTLIYQ
ncbi:MAG TPA: M6 family metalloprotease domain-containing protein, partial [Salinivirgaceae bacterium]|nr:M6 family metalloprotease domain-containing protein [Salinivirgaceae bacterium]